MAWVQVGSRKINTAMVCYMEQQEDEKVTLYFQGEQNVLALDADESRALWKHLKSEDAMAVKDKGSTMVLPKRWSAAPTDVVPAAGTPAKPLQVAVGPGNVAPAGAAQPSSGQPSQPKPHNSSQNPGSSSSRPQQSSSHSSSSHRPSSQSQPSSSSSSQHRSSSNGGSSHSSSSKPTEAARVLEFKKD